MWQLQPLTQLWAYGCDLGYFDLTNFTTSTPDIRLQDNNMTQGEVDNFLSDLVASGWTGGTLNIAGSNAAPGASGLADKATLEGYGSPWTVTVTP